MIPEYSLAVLTTDIPKHYRKKGEVGTVIDVYDNGVGYLLEFEPSGDHDVEILAVKADQVIAVKAEKRLSQTYKELNSLGLSRHFLNNFIIPRLYQEEALHNEAGMDRLTQYLSSSLGITSILMEKDRSDLPNNTAVRFFNGPIIEDLAGSGRLIAVALAKAALTGYARQKPVSIPNADDLRRLLLSSGEPYVNFESLLRYCWDNGVPVLHAYNLPASARKSRGAALEINGRPVIVLCYRTKSPAKHLVPIAHEIGHLANQHIIQRNLVTGLENEVMFNEETEIEASRYATRLVTGGNNRKLDLYRSNTPQEIADKAESVGRTLCIDPGYLLNFELGSGYVDPPIIGAASKIIDDGNDAIELMRSYTYRYLDWESISRESYYLLNSIAFDGEL